MYEYILNKDHSISLNNNFCINGTDVLNAILFTNNAISTLHDATNQFDINIFEVLGMRNLSGLVGEYFAKSMERFSNGNLSSNLHQDGYPDLLLTDTNDKKEYLNSLINLLCKEAFSPFKFGGIEVKATCGTTPSASRLRKPVIGEQRIINMIGFDWKAHHRGTNNLLGILWDFIDTKPTIIACFFRNDLTENDWGNIVQPKDGGGRTTSVSIMKSCGVKKMCNGWIAVIDKQEYIDVLSREKWIGYRVS